MSSEDDIMLEERKLSMMIKMKEAIGTYTDKQIEQQKKIVEALKGN